MHSVGVSSKAAIQLGKETNNRSERASTSESSTEKRERERASNDYSRMHSVEESLLRSRHSFGSETDAATGRDGASARERFTGRKGASDECCPMYSVEESLVRRRHSFGSKTKKEREQRCRMHSVGACSEAAIQTDTGIGSTRDSYT
jgi:hypothetical protein